MDKFLTFRTDLADFLHIVLGAIVDGMRDSALADSLVLAGRCRAEHGHVLHRLAQLSGGNAHATCRKLINSYDFMKKTTTYDLWWILLQRPLTWIQVHLVVQGGTELNRAVAEGTQEFPISQAFSIAGKCDFHHLLSKSINPVDVFCSRVCKERIKHNRITPTGLGRIDTHTQMHNQLWRK